MKRATLSHPKTKRLARRLKVPRPHALGILAMLWDWTGEYAPQGDVGRHDDEDIAEAVDWPDDQAEALVTALVDCGWLDRHPEHRLIVHDYHDHAEEWIRRRNQRSGMEFVTRRDGVATPSSQCQPGVATAPQHPAPPTPRLAPPTPRRRRATATPTPARRMGRGEMIQAMGVKGGRGARGATSWMTKIGPSWPA